MTDTTNLDLTVSRVIKAPRAVVWAAWSDPRRLEEWWCPKPWRAEVQAFEFAPGGAFDVVMHGPDGEANPHPGSFLDVTPMERIVFTTMLTAGWRPATPWLAVTGVVVLKDHPDGTDYSATALHGDQATCDRHEEMGFYDGWGACLAQLAEAAERGV